MKLTSKQNFDGKWGFVDSGDRWVIEPIFDEVTPQLVTGKDLAFDFVDFLDGNSIVKYDGNGV